MVKSGPDNDIFIFSPLIIAKKLGECAFPSYQDQHPHKKTCSKFSVIRIYYKIHPCLSTHNYKHNCHFLTHTVYVHHTDIRTYSIILVSNTQAACIYML